MEVTNKRALARELGVSRSSLYYRPEKPDKDEALRREIERVMLNNPGYGSPRVAIALKINEKRAARVITLAHLLCSMYWSKLIDMGVPD